MKRLVQTQLVDGGVMLVEVEEADESAIAATSGRVVRGMQPSDAVERVQLSFEAALNRLSPTAEQLVAQLRGLADAPDQVSLEFGLTMSANAGVVLASAGVTANFKVSLSWHRKPA